MKVTKADLDAMPPIDADTMDRIDELSAKWLEEGGPVGAIGVFMASMTREIRRLRSLPVLRSCGDCAHYADVRDGQCEYPFQRPFHETGRNDAPPAWCPLRRST